MLTTLTYASPKSDQVVELLGFKNDWDSLLEKVQIVNMSNGFEDSELWVITNEHGRNMDEIREKYLNWEDVRLALSISFEQLFTEEELEQLILFLASPIGQKLYANENELQRVFGEEVQEKVQRYLAATQDELARYQQELSVKSESIVN